VAVAVAVAVGIKKKSENNGMYPDQFFLNPHV
jgi:hypothetical protein